MSAAAEAQEPLDFGPGNDSQERVRSNTLTKGTPERGPAPDRSQEHEHGGTRVKSTNPPNTCSRCDATWTGSRACHCSQCHRTFAGLALFDRHRHARGETGGCIDPDTIRNERTGEPVMFLREGIWAGPEMSDEQKAAAFGGRS